MVKVENITYAYHRSSGNILEQVGFEIKSGQCIAVLGNNGAGKSTLLKCIDRINPTHNGVVMVEGKNVFEMNARMMAQNVAYVPQNAGATDMTVFDTVLLGRKPYIKWDVSAEDRKIAGNIIHQMGLDNYVLRSVSELSGGEAQKVMLARALAQEPHFLLLDEPTSNLDPRNQHEVLRIVRDIAQSHNICVMIIIHDLNLAVRYCDKFLFLRDAKIYSYGGLETMTLQTIRDVYDMEAEVIHHNGIPMIVPYPSEEKV